MCKAVVLALSLLVAGIQAMEGPSYGVKLCGREFIRAVIFTCGGSRWKRSLWNTGELAEDLLGSQDDESSQGWSQDPLVEGLFQQSTDLDLHSPSRDGQESVVFSRRARSLVSDVILEALRKADRKGRDVVVGLSNACCKWGCSKSEISSLC